MSKSFVRVLVVGLAAAIAAVSAQALTFYDVDVDGNNGEPDWYYMNSRDGSNKHWNATFDLLSSGFDPLTMRILSATVFFAFADDNNDRDDEYVRVKIENDFIWNWQEVDGSHYNSPYSYDWYASSLSQSLLDELQDGALDYQVKALRGDFYLKEAAIFAEVEQVSNVPDSGATVAFLGLGVAVLFVLRRQMKAAA